MGDTAAQQIKVGEEWKSGAGVAKVKKVDQISRDFYSVETEHGVYERGAFLASHRKAEAPFIDIRGVRLADAAQRLHEITGAVEFTLAMDDYINSGLAGDHHEIALLKAGVGWRLVIRPSFTSPRGRLVAKSVPAKAEPALGRFVGLDQGMKNAYSATFWGGRIAMDAAIAAIQKEMDEAMKRVAVPRWLVADVPKTANIIRYEGPPPSLTCGHPAPHDRNGKCLPCVKELDATVGRLTAEIDKRYARKPPAPGLPIPQSHLLGAGMIGAWGTRVPRPAPARHAYPEVDEFDLLPDA